MKANKFMLLAIIGMIIAVTLSCSTRQERHERRAQRHFRKAISLDPSLVQAKSEIKDSIRITDSVRIRDSVVIIPKTVLQGNLGNPCDSLTGKLRPFEFRFGAGPTKARIWSDGKNVYYESTTDSLISRIRSLEQKNQHTAAKSEVKTNVVTVTKTVFRNSWWQLICVALVSFLLGYLSRMFKKILNSV